jgi:hypothetical protein
VARLGLRAGFTIDALARTRGVKRTKHSLTFEPIWSVQSIPFFNPDRVRNLRVFPEF